MSVSSAARFTYQDYLLLPQGRRYEILDGEPDYDPPIWRIRIGSWRIFYEIDDAKRIVSLTAADHRKDAYR